VFTAQGVHFPAIFRVCVKKFYLSGQIIVDLWTRSTLKCSHGTFVTFIQENGVPRGKLPLLGFFHYNFWLVLLWAQLTKIYPPLPTSVQPISITKTLRIVPTKNERDPPFFTGKLPIKFQNILRNTTQVIMRHRVKILFSVISSPITLERQKWKSSKMKDILLSSPVNCW
jgi:hypothetical protein